jgi:8-oxo-dGTP pyrophosphatase MutT (NUDIX family)
MIDKVGGIILNKGKMLVSRNDDKTVFFIPGGKREDGESDLDTLRREIMEELGVNALYPMFYKELVTMSHDFTDRLKIRSYFIDIDSEPTPNNEIAELLWIDRNNYSDFNLSDPLKVIVENLIKDGVL